MPAQNVSTRVLDKAFPVLVVDDSPTTCQIVKKLFQKVGFLDVECCLSGREALEKLKMRKYGLLVTDLEMAPMSGLELIKAVRNDPSISSTPVVLTTGNLPRIKEMIAGFDRSGAEVQILKPFTTDDLVRKLSEAFSWRAT